MTNGTDKIACPPDQREVCGLVPNLVVQILEGRPKKQPGIVAESQWSELLTATQLGEAGAYRLFLTSILPFVNAIVRKRIWSEKMAADVAQDVLLTVHRVRHTYEPGRAVEPWLAAIAVRRSIDALRRRDRTRARTFSDSEILLKGENGR